MSDNFFQDDKIHQKGENGNVEMQTSNDTERMEISPEEIAKCIATLEHLNNNTDLIFEIPKAQRTALIKQSGRLSRPNRDEFSRRKKDAKKAETRKQAARDRTARKDTGIRSARENIVFVAPKLLQAADLTSRKDLELTSPRNCYVCKTPFTTLHHFYDTMCAECGDFNYAKRFQTADLTGQVAIITGSRLKIGYHITLMLLRAGATVIATTRFPADSAYRFSQEEDFHKWADRLKIHGLDLRHIPSVEIFCNYISQQYENLDILINTAAETVRRPAGFYKHMMAKEEMRFEDHPIFVRNLLQDHYNCLQDLKALTDDMGSSPNKNLPVTWHGKEPGIGIRASAKLSQIPYSFDNSLKANEVFPEGELDADLQQVDLRKTNSWRLRLGEIMKKTNTGKKHIINVSAMEGKFHRFHKEDRHPHTNMAKAALNMLTHTASGSLAKEGIYINAVDTGWVTDEDPIELAKRKMEIHDFQPPLDIVDGAARVMDPLIDGINTGKHWNGKFLKDYMPIDW